MSTENNTKNASEEKKAKQHGKNYKRQINRLDPNFREKLLSHAQGSKMIFTDAIAILFATGCRPCEIEKGIKVSLDIVKGTFRFEIQGAKVNDERGIKTRVFEVPMDLDNGESWQEYLFEKCAEKQIEIKIANSKSLGNAITNASKEIWPKRAEHVSPYSFRHALATELKSSGLDKITVASVLGHASTASQDKYGRKNGSNGQPPVVSVETSREVKQKSPLDRFKKKKVASVSSVASKVGKSSVSTKRAGFKM